jgi:hypothetical protein
MKAGASPAYSRAFASGLHCNDDTTALVLPMANSMQESATLGGSRVRACNDRVSLHSRLVKDLLGVRSHHLCVGHRRDLVAHRR